MKKQLLLQKVSPPNKKRKLSKANNLLDELTNVKSFSVGSTITVKNDRQETLGSITRLGKDCFNLSVSCLNTASGAYNRVTFGFYDHLSQNNLNQILPEIFLYPKTFDDLMFQEILNESYSHEYRLECTSGEFQELKTKIENIRTQLQQQAYVMRETCTDDFCKSSIASALQFYDQNSFLQMIGELSAPTTITPYFATKNDIEKKPDWDLKVGELKGFSMTLPRGTMTLGKYLQNKSFDLNTFFHILKSMKPFWEKGLEHCDLGRENLMVRLDENKELEIIFPIDFDFCTENANFPHAEDIQAILIDVNPFSEIFNYFPYDKKKGFYQKIKSIAIDETNFQPHLWLLLNYGCDHQDSIQQKLELIDTIIKSNRSLYADLLSILLDKTQFSNFTDQKRIEGFRLNFIKHACQKHPIFNTHSRIIEYQNYINETYPY